MKKESILKHLISEQKQVIEDLKTEIDNRRSAADIDEEDTIDDDDFAQQEVNKDFVRRFRDQLDVAQSDLATLKSFIHKESNKIEPGALVDTDNFCIVVGVSVKNSKYDGKKVICMSEEAPAYEKNKNKKEGDELELGQKMVTIKNIY